MYSSWRIISEIGFLFFVGNLLDSNRSSMQNTRVLNTNIADIYFLNASKQIDEWVNKTSDIISQHWWRSSLPPKIQVSFDSITQNVKITEMYHSLFRPNVYTVEELTEMNELYITGEERANENMNSDHVFYTPHLDGPFYFLPFTSVYRSIIGVNDNNNIITYFPVSKTRTRVETGDVLAFDFNREIHYIYNQHKQSDAPRITIKAHYCIYPKYIKWLGKQMCALNVHYNRLFRLLFLKTIAPTNGLELLFGKLVVFGTNVYVYTEMWIGYNNILLAFLCLRVLDRDR